MIKERAGNSLGVVIIGTDRIVACQITYGSKKPFRIIDHSTLPLSSVDMYGGLIFNPTKLDQFISQFFTEKNMLLAFALTPPHLYDAVYEDGQQPPLPEDSLFKKMYLFSHYLTQKPYWYCTALPHPVLLQYQLMSTRTQRDITIITSSKMAHLALYRYCYGHAFRSTQLAVDMYKKSNVIEALVSSEQTFHLAENYHSFLSSHNKELLLTALGLAVMKGACDEAY